MSLWKNIDHPTQNGKPKFANTSNSTSASTTHGSSANAIGNYGNVYGVSAAEQSHQRGVANPGWVSQKIFTGPVKSISIVSGGTGYNSGGFLKFTDTSWLPGGTGANASFAIANVMNTQQAFSSNSSWNVISSITIVNGGSGYSNAVTLSATANIGNSTAATFGITLGGRAGRIHYETLVAMGSITGDDPRDNVFFWGV